MHKTRVSNQLQKSLKKYFQIASIATIFALHASFLDQQITHRSLCWSQLSVASNRLTHLFRAPRKRDIVQLSPHRIQCKSGQKVVRETPKKHDLETAGRVVFLTAHTYKGHLWFRQSLGSRKISLFFGLDVQFCVQVNFFEVWILAKLMLFSALSALAIIAAPSPWQPHSCCK